MENLKMRRVLFIASLFFLMPLCAKGQEAPSAEVFGGYSFLHTEAGGDLHGWNASVAANLNKWFGLVADVSGHYDSSSSSVLVTIPGVPTIPPLPGFPPFTFRSSTDTNIHTILVGPRFSYRKKEKITPFGHALFGVSRTHIESRFSLRDSFEDSFTVSDTTFAMAIGAGLDMKLSNSLALRVIQADYLYKRVGRDERNNLRAGVGIVFRFGDK
jgi:opacity protein-like surface antigen